MSGRYLVIGAGLLLSAAAHAFGTEGHQAVGAMADGLLKESKAGARVAAILAKGESLQLAAIWPDCARGIKPVTFEYSPDPKYYDETCGLFDKHDGGVAEMKDYVRRNDKNCLYAGKAQECHRAFHFTNIPLQLGSYAAKSVGAGPADVVHAIRAAIIRLRDGKSTPPFRFGDGSQGAREALRLLAHLVGDIHQPLHVGSVYLSEGGQPTNPNRSSKYKGKYDNYGGNSLLIEHGNLHSHWDNVDAALLKEDLTGEALTVPATRGPIESWSTQWASESIQAGRTAFAGLAYEPRVDTQSRHGWPVTMKHPEAYERARTELQRSQVIKAGARLAEALRLIWPD